MYNNEEEGNLCRKHYLQFMRHGKFLERTIYDENKINVKEDIAEIEMYNKVGDLKGVTIIDKEDIPKIKGYKVYLDPEGYARVSLEGGKKEFVHNIIKDIDGYTDHKNKDKLDNRKSNLRKVNHQQNAYNVDKGLYKGVREPREGKFVASIHYNYKTYHLGTYENRDFALYARYLSELEFCPEYRDKSYDKKKEAIFEGIPDTEQDRIENRVDKQITKLRQRYSH